MNPPEHATVPDDPTDLHTNEARTFSNPWDEPATSAPTTSPVSSHALSTPPPVAATPLPKKRRLSRGVRVFTSLVVVAFGVAYGVAPLFAERVSEQDLVSSSTSASSFLRPEQWKEVERKSDTHIIYGNKLASEGKSTALMVVIAQPTNSGTITNLSESELAQVRDGLLAELTEERIAELIGSNQNTCTDLSNVQRRADTRQTDSLVGLIHIEADCTRSDGLLHVALRMTAGNDGNFHAMIIASADRTWEHNKPAYTKIFDSLAPRGTVTMNIQPVR